MIHIKSFVTDCAVDCITILEEDFPRQWLLTLFSRALSRVLV